MSLWARILYVMDSLRNAAARLITDGAPSAGTDIALIDDEACGTRTNDVDFTMAVVALAAKMAKADGVVTQDEVSAFLRFFRPPPGEERNVRRVFDLARQTTAGYESYAKQLARRYAQCPCLLMDVMGGLFHIAAADGVLAPGEQAFLARVAELFRLPDETFARLQSAHVEAEHDPYALLGVARDASFAEIKAAWRRLVADHHPDSVFARGVPSELLQIAHEKTAAFNNAYGMIKKERGAMARVPEPA